MTQTESRQRVAKMTDKHATECSKVAYLGANLSVCDVQIVARSISLLDKFAIFCLYRKKFHTGKSF